MSDQKNHTGTKTFETVIAALIGVFATKLFDAYWGLTDLTSKLIVGGYIVVVLFLATTIAFGAMNWFDLIADKRKASKTKAVK